ncbi:30S ribosomal protein S11 [Candidatus Wolfebacteria bacterium]|nr:30S ribosomal protein S11 [Candidatus Wolfebacteria bacterium]
MGKKRVVKKGGEAKEGVTAGRGTGRLSRRKLEHGVLHVQATYNNTKVILTEPDGGAVAWSSSGSLGFKGAKKGTPFAAAQMGELLGEKAKALGLKEIRVVVRGVGSGRESAIRAFLARSGAVISTIEDRTPVPFNGPQPPKPRRV